MSVAKRTLTRAQQVSSYLDRRTTAALDSQRRRVFGDHELFDARKWHGGSGGPPFGVFRAARLRWWRSLVAEVKTQDVSGVVLSPRQLDDLVHIASKPPPPDNTDYWGPSQPGATS